MIEPNVGVTDEQREQTAEAVKAWKSFWRTHIETLQAECGLTRLEAMMFMSMMAQQIRAQYAASGDVRYAEHIKNQEAYTGEHRHLMERMGKFLDREMPDEGWKSV